MIGAGGGDSGGSSFGSLLDSLAPVAPDEAAAEAMSGPAQALPYQAELEEQFGTDLGHLSAHVGSTALGEVGAGAAQLGDDVAFDTTNPDKEQVAHEVAHALQPGGDAGGKGATQPGDAAEVEASEAASAVDGGGKAGAMAAGRSGGAAMDWTEAANPANEDFWNALHGALASEMTNWLANVQGSALQTWVTHMQSAGEASAGNLVLDSVITAIGAAGDAGTIVGAVLSISKGVYTYMSSQYPAGKVKFNDLVQAQTLAQQSVSQQITNRDHPMFAALTRAQNSETATNRTSVRTAALAAARSGRAGLPGVARIQQALTAGWIDGATDSWDGTDFPLDDAGYFYVTGVLVPANPVNNGHYHQLTAQLDDVERPDGTIEAIRAAWGANTPLSQLPFAVHADLMTVRPLNRWGDRDEGRLEATKPRGGNQYTFTLGGDAGDAERDYFRQNEPNTSHIVPD
jgi:hypothetical protein